MTFDKKSDILTLNRIGGHHMKYLGEKSLSSFLNVFMRVCRYIVFVAAVIVGLVGSYLLFAPLDDPAVVRMARCMEWNLQDKDWITFKNLPFAVRLLFVPYFITVIVLMLKLMKKAQDLFTNFKNNIVFDRSNVHIISSFSKMLIPFSILTFDLGSLFVSSLLLLLCEIFKNGAALQEEHDLTV